LTFQIRLDFEVFVGTKYTRLNHLSKKHQHYTGISLLKQGLTK